MQNMSINNKQKQWQYHTKQNTWNHNYMVNVIYVWIDTFVFTLIDGLGTRNIVHSKISPFFHTRGKFWCWNVYVKNIWLYGVHFSKMIHRGASWGQAWKCVHHQRLIQWQFVWACFFVANEIYTIRIMLQGHCIIPTLRYQIKSDGAGVGVKELILNKWGGLKISRSRGRKT